MESEATFKAKALSHGLTDGEVNDLVARGVNSMSKLAFALTTPGVTPDEAALRRLINNGDPGSVPLGTLSAIRRLVFEAQTLSVALVKSAVEGTEMAGKVELAPAERTHRIAAQKARLQGVSFMGVHTHRMTSLGNSWRRTLLYTPNLTSLGQEQVKYQRKSLLVNLSLIVVLISQ